MRTVYRLLHRISERMSFTCCSLLLQIPSKKMAELISTSNLICYIRHRPSKWGILWLNNTSIKKRNNVATSCDELRPVTIKHVSKQISDILCHTVNTTLETGTFPDNNRSWPGREKHNEILNTRSVFHKRQPSISLVWVGTNIDKIFIHFTGKLFQENHIALGYTFYVSTLEYNLRFRHAMLFTRLHVFLGFIFIRRKSKGVPQGGVLSPTLFNLVLIGLCHTLSKNVEASIYALDICVWSSGVTRI